MKPHSLALGYVCCVFVVVVAVPVAVAVAVDVAAAVDVYFDVGIDSCRYC